MVVNALSFDVEEWFQVHCLKDVVDRKDWGRLKSTVADETRRLLDILDEHDTKATFFVLGWVAQNHPEILKEMHDRGHELASHGFSHKLLSQQSEAVFRKELSSSVEEIKKACGAEVLGFRAPNFSLTRDCLWALDVLKKQGLKYDSSVYPSRVVQKEPLNAPSRPYEIAEGLMEFPGSTYQTPLLNIPFGGGAFMRLEPYFLTRRLIKNVNKNGNPAMVYMHPWELNPEHPKIACSLKAAIVHYLGLTRSEKILVKLLGEFEFAPVREVLGLRA